MVIIELEEEEIERREEERSKHLERSKLISAHLYIILILIMLVMLVQYRQANSESLKAYLAFFFAITISISLWAIYIDSPWI